MRTFTFVLALSFVLAPCFTVRADEGSVGDYLSKLSSRNVDVRIAAAQALGELGGLAEEAIPALVHRAQKSTSLAERHEAVNAIGQIAAQPEVAVPVLQQLLSAESVVIRHGAIEALDAYGTKAASAAPALKQLLKSDNRFLSVPAAAALLTIEPDSKETTNASREVLVAALGDSNEHVRNAATAGLVELGPEAVPALIDVLRGKKRMASMQACAALAEIGPVAADAAPALVARLDDRDDVEHLVQCINAVGAIGGQSKTVVPKLAALLEHNSTAVRSHAAYALGEFGPEGKGGTAALAAALGDPELEVRLAAARALGMIGPDAGGAVKALDNALDDSSGSVTLAAVEALSYIGKPAVPALQAHLKEGPLRILAAHALGVIGPDAAPAVPELVAALDDKEDGTRREVLIALSEIGRAAKDAVKPLMKIVETKGDPRRSGAVFVLAKIAPDAIEPKLLQLIKDSDERVRTTSAWALVLLNPKDDTTLRIALPTLRKSLSSEMPIVRREVAKVLSLAGPKAAPAVGELTEALKFDDDPEARAAVLEALAAIGEKSAPAVPQIVMLLDDPAPPVQRSAVYALGRIGPAAAAAIPTLTARLRRRNDFDRTVAAWALAQIEPTPEIVATAIPLLSAALKKARPEACVEIARVLGEIGKGSAQAKAALEAATRHENVDVRKAAVAALDRLRQ